MSPISNNPGKLRVGAVSYLNTKPLVHGLARLVPDAEIVFDLPSRLADDLAEKRLDIALIPSTELLQHPEYTVVSDACIACRGPVLSVKLLSRVPFDQIQSVALDEGSRTSATLVQILLHERFGLMPEIGLLPIGQGLADTDADAALLIGDRAIHLDYDAARREWDLGEQWCALTGLPFVFAMWTVRPGVDFQEIGSALAAARDAGVAGLREIARVEAGAIGLDEAAGYHYLRDNLHFHLGAEERQGLRLFFERAAGLGLLPAGLAWNERRFQLP